MPWPSQHRLERVQASRAKLVRADFTQAIGEHWRNRRSEWNRLAAAVA